MKFKVGDVVIIKDRSSFITEHSGVYHIPFGTNTNKLKFCDGVTPHEIVYVNNGRIKLKGVGSLMKLWSWPPDAFIPYVDKNKDVTGKIYDFLRG